MPRKIKTQLIEDGRVITRRRSARKTNVGTVVAITRQGSASPHLVNLKNPYPERFSAPALATAKIIPSEPVAWPRPVASRPKIGVNFAGGGGKAARQLSIVLLVGLIVNPVKKIFFSWRSRFFLDVTKSNFNQTEDEIQDIFAPPNHFQFSLLTIPRNWYRQLAVFGLTAIVLVLPLQALTYYQDLQQTQDRVLVATNEAIERLQLGQQAAVKFDWSGATLQFNAAKSNFISAQEEIGGLNALASNLLKMIPGTGSQFSAGVSLLKAGEIIAEIGNVLVADGQALFSGGGVDHYYQALGKFHNDLKQQIEQFKVAKNYLEAIALNDVPVEHRDDFQTALNFLPTIESGLRQVYLANDAFLKILGHEQWQRYLIIFLNNNELRATGGFMGSFAMVDVDRGAIKKITIPAGGTYDIQGQLSAKVISPDPLHLINPRWEFQDANWWPDYPASAKKIEWFYQQAGGPSVDGVISVTNTFMERLLEIFGPVEMPEYGRTITAENFTLETQKIVELEYDRQENRPKQFIADLAPKILDRIFMANREQLSALVPILMQSLNERHIALYFNSPGLQTLMTDFGWSGELKATAGDYLSVVHTNIAGGKTDGVIQETIDHAARVQSDGSIIDTVMLTRRHTGVAKENIFTGVQNNSYVRFYVPLGSTFLSATGFNKPSAALFEQPSDDLQTDDDLLNTESEHSVDALSGTEIYTEHGKTVFGNWLQLKPGEVRVAKISYRLPFSLAAAGDNNYFYSFLAQKQAGSRGSELSSVLMLNDNLKPLTKYPATLSADDGSVNFNTKLTTDQFYGVVLIAK